MIAYSRPKLSYLYTLCKSKLLENHTLHSGTYLYSPYMAEPPPPGIHVVKVLEVKNYNFFRDSHEPVYITQYFFNCSSIKTVHYPNLLILFSIGYSQIQTTDPNRPTSTRADSSVLKYKIHLSMLSPRGGGSRASHGVLTVRSVPRVGILIVQDIRRVGNLT